jgi:hypothetical protein
VSRFWPSRRAGKHARVVDDEQRALRQESIEIGHARVLERVADDEQARAVTLRQRTLRDELVRQFVVE